MMLSNEVIFFTVFLIGIFAILAFDLGILNPKSHVVSFKEAAGWTCVWFTLSMLFYFFLRHYGHIIHGVSTVDELINLSNLYSHKLSFEGLDWEEGKKLYNRHTAFQYLTGFFIEYSLSADNLFVILLIFKSFGVQKKHYKIILMWGIIGAVVMRFIFIFAGAALIQQFHWILYVFGAFLIYSGFKILFSEHKKKDEISPEDHPMVKWVGKYFAIFPKNIKNYFAFRHPEKKKTYVTPLFIVLLVVEFSDLIFAVDSVPAIFSVTRDPYIVFFANIFAILGLRSLFFLLANVVNLFHYLGYGLGTLLIFIGSKLLFEEWYASIGLTTVVSLYIILGILGTSILLSLIFPLKKEEANGAEPN